MPLLIDTDVAIHWRDLNLEVIGRLEVLSEPPHLSFMTRIELLNGVYREAELSTIRRVLLQRILESSTTLPFTDATLARYEAIIAATGYARRKVNDRLIAATALEHGLTLATMNAVDFRDVPGLAIEDWGGPT